MLLFKAECLRFDQLSDIDQIIPLSFHFHISKNKIAIILSMQDCCANLMRVYMKVSDTSSILSDEC